MGQLNLRPVLTCTIYTQILTHNSQSDLLKRQASLQNGFFGPNKIGATSKAFPDSRYLCERPDIPQELITDKLFLIQTLIRSFFRFFLLFSFFAILKTNIQFFTSMPSLMGKKVRVLLEAFPHLLGLLPRWVFWCPTRCTYCLKLC